MSKRIVKTWVDIYSKSLIDKKINGYAEQNNLELISVSLSVGWNYYHVSAVYEKKEDA